MDDNNLKLYQKLYQVRLDIHSIAYDSVNAFEKFAYVSSPIVLKHIRESLNKNRLIMETDMHSYKSTLRADGKTIFTECEFTYKFICIDTGAYTECRFIGQGIAKSSEKGVGKAATYSEKYFLLKYFNLPTHKNNDPDFKREEDKLSNAPPLKLVKAKQTKKPEHLVAAPSQQVKNAVSQETPAAHATSVPAEENDYKATVFSFFDEKQIPNVVLFAEESANRQGIEVERLYESASKRKADFQKAYTMWVSKQK